MKKLIIIIILLFPVFAFADDWYVTSAGAGSRNGSSLSNAWSVSDFNALTGTGYAGDTFYFSGAISSEIEPQIIGTVGGGYVTLDGYEAGDYDAIGEGSDGQSVITLSASEFAFTLWKSAYGENNGKDYLIIQDFEITGGSAIYAAEDCDHIIVRRNFVHDVPYNGMYFGYSSTYSNGNNYITVGGAPGDGNVVKNVGTTTAHGDINFGRGNDIIISYNHLYATPGDRGIDGIILNHDTYNVLIEYNSIHSHNDNSGDKGEDGIDIKDDSRTGGCYDIIVRYNHVYDHQYQSTVNIQTVSHYIYVYGNSLHDSNWGGVYIYEGGNGIGGAPPVNNIWIFSNLIFDQRDVGSRVVSTEYGQDAHHIYYFNNTFSENGIDDHGDTFTHIQADIDPDNIEVKNNIFYKARIGYTSYQERMAYFHESITDKSDMNYNQYHWPGKTSTIYLNDTWANAIGGHVGAESNGAEGDPGLVDIDNNDYRIAPGAAVIGAGLDIGSGAIANVTIQGVVYPVYWDAALGPNTDFTGTDPSGWTIDKQRRDDHQWDIGAYIYTTGTSPPMPIVLRRHFLD